MAILCGTIAQLMYIKTPLAGSPPGKQQACTHSSVSSTDQSLPVCQENRILPDGVAPCSHLSRNLFPFAQKFPSEV